MSDQRPQNDPERMAEVRARTARQVRGYEASGGTQENSTGDYPIVIVTSTGAKSGEPRKFAVIRVEKDGEYAVVASIGGMPRNPAWYHNLVANPTALLQDGDVVRTYTAREVEGDERARWWELAASVFPSYAEYQKKTDRQIPLFVFTPVD